MVSPDGATRVEIGDTIAGARISPNPEPSPERGINVRALLADSYKPYGEIYKRLECSNTIGFIKDLFPTEKFAVHITTQNLDHNFGILEGKLRRSSLCSPFNELVVPNQGEASPAKSCSHQEIQDQLNGLFIAETDCFARLAFTFVRLQAIHEVVSAAGDKWKGAAQEIEKMIRGFNGVKEHFINRVAQCINEKGFDESRVVEKLESTFQQKLKFQWNNGGRVEQPIIDELKKQAEQKNI